jgi:hypothetical protein
MTSSQRPSFATNVMYRRFPSFTFDLEYYLLVHIPICLKYWEPHGMVEHYVTQVRDVESEFAYVITMVWKDEVTKYRRS